MKWHPRSAFLNTRPHNSTRFCAVALISQPKLRRDALRGWAYIKKTIQWWAFATIVIHTNNLAAEANGILPSCVAKASQWMFKPRSSVKFYCGSKELYFIYGGFNHIQHKFHEHDPSGRHRHPLEWHVLLYQNCVKLWLCRRWWRGRIYQNSTRQRNGSATTTTCMKPSRWRRSISGSSGRSSDNTEPHSTIYFAELFFERPRYEIFWRL